MMLSNTTAQRDIDHLLHPFTPAADHEETGPLIIERGSGIFVYDAAGKEYIEGISGLWCTSLGFSNRQLIDAAIEQLRKIPSYHLAAHKGTPVLIDLAEKLKAIAPSALSKVFFVNSGSEANDTQIKLLNYYNNAMGRPAKKKIISRANAYHGVTMAASSLCGLDSVHRAFDVSLDAVRFAECPHYSRSAQPGETEEEYSTRLAAELEALILREGPDTVAGFIAEPVMGAGGVIVPPKGYFDKVQPILARYDIRFIVDEVITGFGRIGEMWGSQVFGINCHSLSCAKALSSAYLPIGAVMMDEPMYDAIRDQSRTFGSLAHGFTFGGHPVAAAVALRNLQIMEEQHIVDHVKRVSPRFQERLESLNQHPLVGETRGIGLLGALDLVADKESKRKFSAQAKVGSYCARRCEFHGLIARLLGDTACLCPPLVISQDEIDCLFDRLKLALDDTIAWAWREHHMAD